MWKLTLSNHGYKVTTLTECDEVKGKYIFVMERILGAGLWSLEVMANE